ncbi:CHY zinc finger protein [Sporosarcina koreensis]|uniref:CHY zinc finger protein n=1 Tax=Sporosarcina koreensis TaxID=334735 RepID=UPI0009E437A7|nr:CHY zinc finger protein [Sporosarcina koreensis]
MEIHEKEVVGEQVDEETRCQHYHSEVDRIAIKFFCCQTYYPCYECHGMHGCGHPAVWPASRFSEKAVLCGACRFELSVTEYLSCGSACPACSAPFNPGCSLHKHLYFDTSK